MYKCRRQNNFKVQVKTLKTLADMLSKILLNLISLTIPNLLASKNFKLQVKTLYKVCLICYLKVFRPVRT